MKKLTLVEDAALIARRAWSMRLIYVSVVLGVLDQVLPYFAPEHAGRGFGLLSLLVGSAAGISRVVAQPAMKG